MKKPPINTTKQAFPQIYAYTTPGVTYHDGWTKIGYTEHKDARTRIDQQTVTADIHYQLEWSLPAIYDDGSFLFPPLGLPPSVDGYIIYL